MRIGRFFFPSLNLFERREVETLTAQKRWFQTVQYRRSGADGMKVPVTILLGLTAFYGLSGCTKSTMADRYAAMFRLPLSPDAIEVTIAEPSWVGKWRDDYGIVEYRLPEKEFLAFVSSTPPGYSEWQPFSELYVGGRFFTYAKMPHAVVSIRDTAHLHQEIIANPETCKIDAARWVD